VSQIRYPANWHDLEPRGQLVWKCDNIKKPYVVIEDLSPFVINFWSQHSTLFGAEWARSGSAYLEAVGTRAALERDLQMIEDAESGIYAVLSQKP
jgi:hypothetical protein